MDKTYIETREVEQVFQYWDEGKIVKKTITNSGVTYSSTLATDFIVVIELPTIEIVTELVEEALISSDDWVERISETDEYRMALFDMSHISVPKYYTRDGWKIKVLPESIQFGGPFAHLIDPEIDLVIDDELVGDFIEWLYEGWAMPLMKELEEEDV